MGTGVNEAQRLLRLLERSHSWAVYLPLQLADAMAMANSSYIKQIKEDTGTTDEFGLFLLPLGDNSYFPTNPAGPTMFGYNGSEHPELVKEFFKFVCSTESLQEILDNC